MLLWRQYSRGKKIQIVVCLIIFLYFFNNFVLVYFKNDHSLELYTDIEQQGGAKIITPLRSQLFEAPDNSNKILQICMITPAFTDYGGVEYWIKSMNLILKDINGFHFYGIYAWDLKSNGFVKFLIEENLYYLNTIDEVLLDCDITLNTAFHPMNKTEIVDILVIHGGGNDAWTQKYSKDSHAYDFIIGVSKNSFKAAEISDQKRTMFVPTYVFDRGECLEPLNHYRYCKNQFLFVGRISPEKRPELFCDLVCDFKDFCGLMIGPVYFDFHKLQCDCDNFYYLGSKDDINCYMKNSDYLITPSINEGGPIVAIEAWIQGLPVVMDKIGLATDFEDSFLIYHWDKYSKKSFQQKILNSENTKKTVQIASQTYQDNFSKEKLTKTWGNILSDARDLLIKKGNYFNYYVILVSDIFYRKQGKRNIFDCLNFGCAFRLMFDDNQIYCFDTILVGIDREIIIKVDGKQLQITKLKENDSLCIDTLQSRSIDFEIGKVQFTVHKIRVGKTTNAVVT